MPQAFRPAYTSANKQKYLHRDRLSLWHLRSVMEAIYRLLAQSEPKSVLDAGCGEGFVTKYLADRDPRLRLTGVDVSPEAIEYAQARFGDVARFCTGSVFTLPFSDNSFDTVVCSEVLEHINDAERAVQELKRVARRYVLITVPREPIFKWLNDFARAIKFSQDPEHVNFWTSKSFRLFVRTHFDDPVFARKHVIYQLALAKL